MKLPWGQQSKKTGVIVELDYATDPGSGIKIPVAYTLSKDTPENRRSVEQWMTDFARRQTSKST